MKVGTDSVMVTSRQQVDAEYSRWLKEDAADGCVVWGIHFSVKSGRWHTYLNSLVAQRLSRLPRSGWAFF